MNAFNEQILKDPECALTECCDKCNRVITNWDFIKLSFISENGVDILCLFCFNDERRNNLLTIKCPH